jgi:transcription initiation factor TFIIB
MSAFKQRRAQAEAPTCPACGSDDVVMDQKQGQLVCQDCGVILEESRISESTEYRNFAEPDRPTG